MMTIDGYQDGWDGLGFYETLDIHIPKMEMHNWK